MGGRVQSFLYEDHVRAIVGTWCFPHLVFTACSACLQVYESGASIVFAKNYYVR